MNPISREKFNANPPSSEACLAEVESELKLQLPDDYAKFMLQSNGGEGLLGHDLYVMFWKLEELSEFNRDYEVGEYCQELLLFGSNGGGEAFGFDTRTSPFPVVQVPFVGMSNSHFETIGGSFTEFLCWAANQGDES